MVLDHHKSGDDLGATELKDVSAEATGVLVVEASDALGLSLTSAAATPLFAAIATDTGWFRFPSTSSRTYQVASRLTDAGASPAEIYGHLYERETIGRLRLRGVVLARVRTACDGANVAVVSRSGAGDESEVVFGGLGQRELLQTVPPHGL